MQLRRPQGSSPGVLLVAAGAWLLPSSGPLGSLRKLEIGEACGAEEVEGAHEDPAPPLQIPTSGEPRPGGL